VLVLTTLPVLTALLVLNCCLVYIHVSTGNRVSRRAETSSWLRWTESCCRPRVNAPKHQITSTRLVFNFSCSQNALSAYWQKTSGGRMVGRSTNATCRRTVCKPGVPKPTSYCSSS
jgi:hypothetical protein